MVPCKSEHFLGWGIKSAALQEQEQRLKKALARAAAPVFRKVGRPVMFRSQPVRKRKVVTVDNRDDSEVELETFLAREML
jgi:hypothetical protein